MTTETDIGALDAAKRAAIRLYQSDGTPTELINYLDTVIEALTPQKQEWQPIESAPRDGTRILVWSDELYMKPYIAWWGVDQNTPEDGNEQEEWLTGDGDNWSTGYYYTPCKPTHFMPLPAAPGGE